MKQMFADLVDLFRCLFRPVDDRLRHHLVYGRTSEGLSAPLRNPDGNLKYPPCVVEMCSGQIIFTDIRDLGELQLRNDFKRVLSDIEYQQLRDDTVVFQTS